MSVIAVELTNDKIRFASDSQMTYAETAYLELVPKVFKVQNIIVGIAGQVSINNYFKRFLETKESINVENEADVMDLIDAYETHYKDNKHASFTDDESIIISNYKEVFYIKPTHHGCFRINEFEAIGSGSPYTIGAYKICKDLIQAVKVACDLNIFCGEPINLLEVTRIKA